MGVAELWSTVESAKETVPLRSFAGKTLAVDLSIWVCQLQTAVTDPSVPKPYLRNLFFRVSGLLKMGIDVVFVTEGKAPELKQETMAKRQQQRKPSWQTNGKMGRSRFQSLLNECSQLLRCLGVCVLQSDGEAEATCAALNLNGLVDGVVTEDGDTFLYGARCVLRRFSMDGKEPTVDVYLMERIQRDLGLGREKMIALGLLVGCDYSPKGVPGVGKEMARKFLSAQDCNSNVLEKIRNWKDKKPEEASELAIWKRVQKMAGFPDEAVLEEFSRARTLPAALPSWAEPNLAGFPPFMERKLNWNAEYAVGKLIPLVTLWNVRAASDALGPISLRPVQILNRRIRKALPYYEVQWEKSEKDQITLEEFYITLESVAFFEESFPSLVKDFDLKKPPRKRSSRKTKVESMAGVALPEPQAVLNSSLVLIEAEEDEDRELETSFRCSEQDLDGEPVEAAAAELSRVSLLSDDLKQSDFLEDSPLPLLTRVKMRYAGVSKPPIN